MASYSPLAVKVFGNGMDQDMAVRMAPMRSLVLSRSWFKLHPRPWLLKRLNRVHMRVLRRITGCISGIDSDGGTWSHWARQATGHDTVDELCCWNSSRRRQMHNGTQLFASFSGWTHRGLIRRGMPTRLTTSCHHLRLNALVRVVRCDSSCR